jgi:hypothetical protein
LEYIRSEASVQRRSSLDCIGSDIREKLRNVLRDLNCIRRALVDEHRALERIRNGLDEPLTDSSFPSALKHEKCRKTTPYPVDLALLQQFRRPGSDERPIDDRDEDEGPEEAAGIDLCVD